jgi:hypothetical protein
LISLSAELEFIDFMSFNSKFLAETIDFNEKLSSLSLEITFY